MVRRRLMLAVAMPLFIGALALTQEMRRPEFAAIRALDVVQLTAVGMCVGVAMVGMVMWLRGKLG
ncbi:MAG: hypothetical protein V4555_12990 [Acidobacteriota bacterium]